MNSWTWLSKNWPFVPLMEYQTLIVAGASSLGCSEAAVVLVLCEAASVVVLAGCVVAGYVVAAAGALVVVVVAVVVVALLSEPLLQDAKRQSTMASRMINVLFIMYSSIF